MILVDLQSENFGASQTTSLGQRDQPVAKGAVLASAAQVGLGELDQVGGVLVWSPLAIGALPHRPEARSRLASAGRGVQLSDPVGMPGS
jgi:hypothetical protein